MDKKYINIYEKSEKNRNRINTGVRKTKDQFIKEALSIHGDSYEYNEVIYKSNKTHVNIFCKKHKKIFQQTPKMHLLGQGCRDCGIEFKAKQRTSNTQEFIEKAIKVHNDKFIYDKINYINKYTKIQIGCKIHNNYFFQTPNSHLNGQGCPECNPSKKMDTKSFIRKAKLIYGDNIIYDKVKYINSWTPVILTCAIHNLEFERIPNNHIQGHGCYFCGANHDSVEKFIEKAIKVHNDKFIYDNVKYFNSKTHVLITCKKHGVFSQKPRLHLKGQGCSKCTNRISKIETEWLDYIEKEKNITLIRQYKIPKTNYTADGFDPISNTIYEFNGDYFHGNPKFHKSNEINKTVKKSFGELYNNTIIKQNKIKELGYNLISIWSSDFKKNTKTNF